MTSSSAWGPVTARTLGWIERTRFAPSPAVFAPRHPVTMTLPFWLSASPIASSDSATASSMNPQVLTTTRSAPS
jgi:hypothetical protein